MDIYTFIQSVKLSNGLITVVNTIDVFAKNFNDAELTAKSVKLEITEDFKLLSTTDEESYKHILK